jgi:hypothetical protein
MISTSITIEVLAAELENLARQTGLQRLAWAARLVRADGLGGGTAKSDEAALQEVRELVKRGKTPWQASAIVARRIAPESVRAATLRLYRKVKNQSHEGS